MLRDFTNFFDTDCSKLLHCDVLLNLSGCCFFSDINISRGSNSDVFSGRIFMVALWNRADHYTFAVVSSPFFFSSPNLSLRRLDVCHTSTHGVALDAGLKPAARGSLKTQDAKKSLKITIWASSHNFVRLYLHN